MLLFDSANVSDRLESIFYPPTTGTPIIHPLVVIIVVVSLVVGVVVGGVSSERSSPSTFRFGTQACVPRL